MSFQNVTARQIEHALAVVDTIDSNQRLACKKRSQESSVPFSQDERPARRTNFAETRDASLLQRVPESNRLKRPVPGRDGIEAHNVVTSSATRGVSKTR